MDRCPHCGIANPLLDRKNLLSTKSEVGVERFWSMYACTTCGGMTLACSGPDMNITEVWPPARSVSNTVPTRARNYLQQAMASLHAPSGAVMLSASSIDAMLKDKGYKTGSLNARIDKAAEDHLITTEMAAWAHEIRLDANDERHADDNATLPSKEDGERVIEFASALAQFLYVLPARVARGRKTPPTPQP